MPSDQTIIITGGANPDGSPGDYWVEYEGRRMKLTGWRLWAARRIAAWVYRYWA